MAAPVLKIDSIYVSWNDIQVLKGVSLEIGQGEIVGVIGPNGSGKSTLMNAIVGFQQPSRGSIKFKGSSVVGLQPEQIVGLGMTIVPEGARVFSEMTVLENLKMGSYVKRARLDRYKTLGKVLDHFPVLLDRINQKAGSLSGGERQMLAIARALMSKPDFLLLDEPSLGLAPMMVTKVMETITEIASEGLTVLLVDQNVHYCLEISDRAYVLENGRVVMQGNGCELMNEEHIRKSYFAL
jgi:branched-chain amino acid transport system ATP-binding protein